MKLAVAFLFAAVAALGIVSIAQAQEHTVDDVKEKFADLTRAEIEAMGYVVDAVCVEAPPGAMGFHAVNESLFDTAVDALEPEVILLGPNDEVWGVEYETAAETENPVVLGQEMPLLEGGHPGMEFDHYSMHVWFVENLAGQFADFNPALTCAGELPPTGGPPPAPGSDANWWLVALGLAAMSLGAATILTWRRRQA